jgi:hypothetical protein
MNEYEEGKQMKPKMNDKVKKNGKNKDVFVCACARVCLCVRKRDVNRRCKKQE